MPNKEIQEIVSKLTLEEKTSLCSGQSFWETQSIERAGIPSLFITDGPTGLRKQEGESDHLGILQSVPATCFPTASATANSFDLDLMKEIGNALAEECLQESVSCLLGPGVNIKRSPLCGRNFEYISEDPFLTGEMASAFIAGLQEKGIAACPKHFAANNQEWCRMSSSSEVDERALREIYLTAFEKIVKKSKPAAIMSSYNKVNGTYASNSKKLLTDILRKEWGFDGIVISDWYAVTDREKALQAGLDLEMPFSGGISDSNISKAVKEGILDEKVLDETVMRLLEFIFKGEENRIKSYSYDKNKHHETAKRAAAEGSVLVRNEDSILPLDPDANIAVIGEFAKSPRYQGAGSSKVSPHRVDTVLDALADLGYKYSFSKGYSLDMSEDNEDQLIEEACKLAEGKDIVIVFAGLPDSYESEGFDREDLSLPKSHDRLISEVSKANENIVVVLQSGSPVLLPWKDKVKGILLSYLGGQAGGSACADILSGKTTPSGKLAETWPLALEDTPSFKFFPGGTKSVQYRESIYVGYRYYDKAEKAVAFPFGYGLSYTTFEYSDLNISGNEVSFTVKNTGAISGTEISQLYIGLSDSKIFRAKKELKGFSRITLDPGESRKVNIYFPEKCFSYYNTAISDWAREGGAYTVQIGASSKDIRLEGTLHIEGDGFEDRSLPLMDKLSSYFNPDQGVLDIPEKEFEILMGRPLPPLYHVEGDPFTLESTLSDLKTTKIGKKIAQQMKARTGGGGEEFDKMVEAMMMHMPLSTIVSMAGNDMNMKMVEGIVEIANGKTLRGMVKMLMNKPGKKKVRK